MKKPNRRKLKITDSGLQIMHVTITFSIIVIAGITIFLNYYNNYIGCLNRICITDNKEEVLTMLASLQYNAMLLSKDTFRRIDEKDNM